MLGTVKKFYIINIFLLFFGLFATNQKDTNILLLHSYSKYTPWTTEIEKAVEDVFDSLNTTSISLYSEYLGFELRSDELFEEKLYNTLKDKYESINFDAIITSGDDAFHFLRYHDFQLFPNVPVMFSGVYVYDDMMLQGFTRYTGITRNTNMKKNIDLILDILPETKEIFVISDKTYVGTLNTGMVYKHVPEYENIKFNFLVDKTIPEINLILEKSKSEYAVLFLSYIKDRDGNIHNLKESISRIEPHSKYPIFTHIDQLIGYGAFGGYVTNNYEQGKRAAETVLDFMSGKKPIDIPVETKIPNKYVFDHNKLLKFSVDQNNLPIDKDIVNAPEKFYRIDKEIIFGFAGFSVIITGFVVTLAVNIYKRKKAERKRKETEYRYFSLFKNMLNGVALCRIVKDKNGEFIDFEFAELNDRIQGIFGQSKEALKGKRAFQVFPDLKTDPFGWFNHMKETVVYGKEMRYIGKSETFHKWFSMSLYTTDKKYFVLILDDITKMKEAEEEIRLFFNVSLDMLCVEGFDGYLKQLSPMWTKSLGWSEKELLEKPKLEFVHPEDLQATMDAESKLFEGDGIVSYENRYKCKDGTYKWLSWKKYCMNQRHLIFGAARDITETKLREKELKQSYEKIKNAQQEILGLERKNTALAMAVTANHEINQPLTVIKGYIQLLMLSLKNKDLSDKQLKYFQKMSQSADRIKYILKKFEDTDQIDLADYSSTGVKMFVFSEDEKGKVEKSNTKR